MVETLIKFNSSCSFNFRPHLHIVIYHYVLMKLGIDLSDHSSMFVLYVFFPYKYTIRENVHLIECNIKTCATDAETLPALKNLCPVI